MYTRRFLAILFTAQDAWATFVVKNTITGVTSSYPTAILTHLSEREDETFANHPVVFVEGHEVCDPTSDLASDLVAGKIVVADLRAGASVDCWPITAAKSSAKLGAVAFVMILYYNAPGLAANAHETFNPKSEKVGIPCVDIATLDVGDAEIDLWQKSRMDGMTASVGPQHEKQFTQMYKSPLWLIVFQIILPVCALLVTVESVAEVQRRSQSRVQHSALRLQQGFPAYRTSFAIGPVIICAVEGLACFAIGVVLIFGHFGPLYLPLNYHIFFFFLLMGSSFFTTIVLALIIHEKSKLLNGMPSRSDDVSILYRKSIAACALICIVGSDIILGVLNAIAPRDNLAHNPARNFTFLFGIYGFGQVIVAVYFLSRARALYWPLVAYLNDPQSTPTSENEAHMKYLAHYLTLSGTAMIVNTCSLISIAVVTSEVYNKSAFVWFGSVFFFSASRICVSHSQVKIVSSYRNEGSVLWKICRVVQRKISFICTISVFRPRVAPHGNPIVHSPQVLQNCEPNAVMLASDPLFLVAGGSL